MRKVSPDKAASAAYELVREMASALPTRRRDGDFGPGEDELDELSHMVSAANHLANALGPHNLLGDRRAYYKYAASDLKWLSGRLGPEDATPLSRRREWLSARCRERIFALYAEVARLETEADGTSETVAVDKRPGGAS